MVGILASSLTKHVALMSYARALLLIFISGLSLFGCERENRRLSVEVATVTGGVQNQEVFQNWSVVKVRRMVFNVCLVDGLRRSPIVDSQFQVAGGPSTRTVKPDNNGCIFWSEDFTVNTLARPTYYELKRQITGVSGRFENQDVRIRIGANPWSGINGSEAAVVFLDRASVPRVMPTTPGEPLPIEPADYSPASLIFSPLSGFAMDGVGMGASEHHVSFTMGVKLRLQAMQAGFNVVSLQEGDFDIWVQVIRQSDEKIFAETAKRPARLINGTITVANEPLKSQISGTGTLFNTSDVFQTRVFLQPRPGGPPQITAAEQTYRLGMMNADLPGSLNVAGADQAAQLISPSVIQERLAPQTGAGVGSTTDGVGGGATPALQPKAHPFVIVTVSGAKNSTTDTQLANNRDRSRILIDYSVQLDTLPVGSAFPEKRFEIRMEPLYPRPALPAGSSRHYPAPESMTRTRVEPVDRSTGTLRWSEEYSFDYFSQRALNCTSSQQHMYRLTLKDKDNPNIVLTRHIQIAPWSGTAVIDISNMGVVPENSAPGHCEQKPLIVQDDQCLVQYASRPEISYDRSLKMKSVFKAQYSATHKIQIYDDPGSINQADEPLRKGVYRLTLVFLRPFIAQFAPEDPDQAIRIPTEGAFDIETTVQKLVRVDGAGNINELVDVEFPDPLRAPVQNVLMSQLEFVDQTQFSADGEGNLDLRGINPASVRILTDYYVEAPVAGSYVMMGGRSCPSVSPSITSAAQLVLKQNNKTLADLHTEFQKNRQEQKRLLKQPIKPELVAKMLQYRFVDESNIAQQLPGFDPTKDTVENLKKGLNCMHDASWAHWRNQFPKCMVENGGYPLINLVQRTWCGEVRRQAELRTGPNAPRRDSKGARLEPANNSILEFECRDERMVDTRKVLWVEKRILIDDFDESPTADNKPRWQIGRSHTETLMHGHRVTVDKSDGSLHLAEQTARARGALAFGPLLKASAERALGINGGAATAVAAVGGGTAATTAGRVAGQGGGAATATGTTQRMSFTDLVAAESPTLSQGAGFGSRSGLDTEVLFAPISIETRMVWKHDFGNWLQRFIIISNSATTQATINFNMELVNVVLRPKRYRECFFIHGVVPHGNTNYENEYEPNNWTDLRDMICFAPQTDEVTLREQYYFVYESVPTSALLYNTASRDGVIFVKFRGLRDYYAGIMGMQRQMVPIFSANRAILPISSAIDRAVKEIDTFKALGATDIDPENFEAKVRDSVMDGLGWRTRQSNFAVDGMVTVDGPKPEDFAYFGERKFSEEQTKFFCREDNPNYTHTYANCVRYHAENFIRNKLGGQIAFLSYQLRHSVNDPKAPTREQIFRQNAVGVQKGPADRPDESPQLKQESK